MSDEDRVECHLRRRRSAGVGAEEGLNLPLNLQVGYRVAEGGPSRGTPSPCTVKFIPSTRENTNSATNSLAEFRKKQQSFEIQIDDCDEEEIVIDSDGEVEVDEMAAGSSNRPITPLPLQDYGSVTYTEGPQPSDYLQVRSVHNECLTDVSDAESEENDGA